MQFIDLNAQQILLRQKIDARIASILDHGNYIMGPEVEILESNLASFCGANHVISCANGTDALQIACMALNLGPGDGVIVPSFSFAATAEAPCLVGATPIFVDSDPTTFNIDHNSINNVLKHTKNIGVQPKAIIAVDLFGLPANYPKILEIANANNLNVICDSAQGWGGSIEGQMTGTFGTITTTSFFPAKPLGCYGDGGAIFTENDKISQIIKSIRTHGKGSSKYENIRVGMNSRLDTLQAGILLEKLAVYEVEIDTRNQIASRYTTALKDLIQTPTIPDGYNSIWAQYTLRATSTQERNEIMSALTAECIPSSIYYPKPLHKQTPYKKFPLDPAGLQNSEHLAEEVFSIPMHPYLSEEDQNKVIEVIKKTLKNIRK